MKSTTTATDKKALLKEGKGNSKKAIPEIKEECRNVFVEELKEIYFSEKALIISIPIMIKNATTEELVNALKVHLQFTQEHIKRLEFFFASIGEAAIILKYEAMYGLIKP
jgi:ferritin-like metal-binding protein YciE